MSRISKNVANWRKRNKERMIKCMGGKCQICGYNKCNEALEFHHLDELLKIFGIAEKSYKSLKL